MPRSATGRCGDCWARKGGERKARRWLGTKEGAWAQASEYPRREPQIQRDREGMQSGGDVFVQSTFIIGSPDREQAAKEARNQGSDPTQNHYPQRLTIKLAAARDAGTEL